MIRVGLLGLEPFLVSQIEGLGRTVEVVLLDAVDDDARGQLELDVVVVSSEHAGAPKVIGSHPSPPVVVIDDGAAPPSADAPGEPVRIQRPLSSPDLLDAIDRSRGVSRLRRSLRAMTIEQDDTAVADRWAAVVRTVATLGALGAVGSELAYVGVVPVVVLLSLAIVRSLWWRLSRSLVCVDAAVVWALILVTPTASPQTELTQAALTILTALVALEVGFVVGFWRATVGALGLMGVLVGVWVLGFDRAFDSVLDASTSGVLALTAVATGAMARRLWIDQTQSRSGELRQFRSALYDLSRRQAVVAVSFDIGTVAHDALQRVISDVRPRTAMVLVADGPGLLQVAASHNLVAPPPVRLTWQAGTQEADRALATPTPPSTTIATDRNATQDVEVPPGQTDGADTAPPPPPAPDRSSAPAALTRRLRESRQGAAAGDQQVGSRVDGNATDDVDEGERAPRTAREEQARSRGRRRAGPDEQRRLADLLDHATIDAVHEGRLSAVLEQLAPSLPSGTVQVHGAELDGELMGALVVVDAADDRSLPRHAEETALALDSVRLFNRLRAFTRDQERARIGRSLHDGVMQTLAHVAFELDRVATESWDESQVDHLGQLRDHVLGTVDEMRAVVNDLRTVRLDRGLPAALEAMGLTLSPAGGPVIEVTTGDVGSLPGDVEEQFLRVAEEALMNAVRHSGARNVGVDLSRTSGALVLQVSDDGFGFTQSRVGAQDGGVGLTSMYQRSKSIGAGLDIDTGPNGTIITLHQPLASTEVVVVPPRQDDVPASSGRQRRWRRR